MQTSSPHIGLRESGFSNVTGTLIAFAIPVVAILLLILLYRLTGFIPFPAHRYVTFYVRNESEHNVYATWTYGDGPRSSFPHPVGEVWENYLPREETIKPGEERLIGGAASPYIDDDTDFAVIALTSDKTVIFRQISLLETLQPDRGEHGPTIAIRDQRAITRAKD